jgi:putative ABC transport system permease protein
MRMPSLFTRSLQYYWPTHLMVLIGVTVAVAVLSGALLVGHSVRASLRELALGRLGATDLIVTAPTFVREELADHLATEQPFTATFRALAPIIAMEGALTHESSGRAATRVQVFGIDERFARFHSLDAPTISGRQALVSPALAAELGARDGDSILLRVAKPTDIPLGALQGRRDEAGERIRLEIVRTLDAASLGEFSLAPAQGPTLALFVPLDRLQRDLDLGGRINTLLVAQHQPTRLSPQAATDSMRTALEAVVQLDDLGLRLRPTQDRSTIVLESRSGLLLPNIVDVAQASGDELGARTVSALSYLANTIRANGREIPYSLVAAVGNGVSFSQKDSGRRDPVSSLWLNEWAADDLGVRTGDQVTLEYYLWSDENGLSTDEATFTLAAVVPMNGIGGDRTLTPEYPGVTDVDDVTSWDPPFPVDLKRVRPKDEQYWDDWRTAPKAFIALERGQALWPSPLGTVSSVRFTPSQAVDEDFTAALTKNLLHRLDPLAAGISVRHARAEALAAAEGTTDFGEYFLYFSFFLVCSALLLTYLFFTLNLEQRTREVGLLSAIGFAPRDLRRHFLTEGAVLAAVAALLGLFGAVGYAALILYGLRTWWIGAVGTRALGLHVDPMLALAGALLTCAAALGAIWLGIRRLERRSARSLLTGATASALVTTESPRARRRAVTALVLAVLGLVSIVLGLADVVPDVAAFFSAGACALVAGLVAASAWLWRGTIGGSLAGTHRSVMRLGIRQASWRPGQTASSLALVAFACFVLVAVGAFRRDPSGASLDRHSGTGGFALMAESVAPLMHDPRTPEGRENLALPDDPLLADLHVARFRLRPGDESSCLTLYRPSNPRLIAPERAFIDENRFAFSASLAETPEERENPWRLLNRRLADGAIPAIADQTSLTYVFHSKVGDDIVFSPTSEAEPVRLRIVGALADSLLQSEIVIGEADFVRLFPRQEGYRLWLIETAAERSPEVATMLEDRLSDFGVDLIDTRQRLAAYH